MLNKDSPSWSGTGSTTRLQRAGGPDGAIVSDGTRRERIAGFRVKAIDATGAGDYFCGATLARLAAGDGIFEAARYANPAAALATTGFGAVAPLPRPEAVRRLIAIGAS